MDWPDPTVSGEAGAGRFLSRMSIAELAAYLDILRVGAPSDLAQQQHVATEICRRVRQSKGVPHDSPIDP